MAIVDTKIVVRPDTSVPFFTETLPQFAGRAVMQSLKDTGKVTIVLTVSDDGLTQTNQITCVDLDAYSAFDTALDIDLDRQYVQYIADNNFRMLSKDTTPRVFTNTGIEQPFTATHVYTFQENDPVMNIFAGAVGLHNGLTVTVGENTVTVVKQYANSADYTDNMFNDLQYVKQLYSKGVTRTISYAYVS